MAKWGRNAQGATANSTTTKETSNGAPIGISTIVKGSGRGSSPVSMTPNSAFGNTSSGSAAAVDVALFGNTTANAFVNNQIVGVFSISANQMATQTGNLALAYVTDTGSGYKANAVVTLTWANGLTNTTAVNAHANTTIGYIDQIKIAAAGSFGNGQPTVSVAAPAAQTFNGNTALFLAKTFNPNTGISASFITIASQPYSVNDALLYITSAGNTAPGGLVSNTTYYVAYANSTGIKLASTLGGANLVVNATSVSETGHTLTLYNFIQIGSNVLQPNDQVTYSAAAGNTVLVGLSNNGVYYTKVANSTGVSLSLTKGGTLVVITPGLSESGHQLIGKTALGYVRVEFAKNDGVAHSGWVVRRAGTGGRAGRVQTEVLVAMGSLGQNSTSSTGVTGPNDTVTSNTLVSPIFP